MSSPVQVDLFAEDRAREALLVPLIRRIAGEEPIPVRIKIRSAHGGHGKALEELKLYEKILASWPREPTPDLLVVAIDGNCVGAARKRQEIEERTEDGFKDRLVAACPDPYIERWYMVDPESFRTVVGEIPDVSKEKCQPTFYKDALARAIREAGHPSTLRGFEFAADLVKKMDLYRAGQQDGSLKAFVDTLRRAFRRLKQQRFPPSAR